MCDCNKNNIKCQDEPCGCISEYSGDCIVYDGEELTNTGIAIGLTFNSLIKKLDEYFGIFKNEINNFLKILNLGNGAKIYKEDDLLGRKLIRSLISTNESLVVTENADEIEFDVQSATESLEGVAEIATQSEVDAGVDTSKFVTPATFNSAITTILADPASLPDATEDQQGVLEIATQSETDAGVDDSRAVTPLKLKTYVDNPVNIPFATEVQRGIAEIATQVEVDAGADDTKFVTPAKLSSNVTTIISNPSNLPDATTAQKGVAELATQTEVNTGSDTERIVTPSTLSTYVSNELSTYVSNPTNLPDATEAQKGVAELATQAEVNTGTDDERIVTPLKLQTKLDSLASGTITQYEELEITTWSQYAPETVTHSLGTVPKLIQLSLRCNSAYDDYAVGDEIEPDYHFQSRPDSPQAFGVALVKSDTNVRLKVGHAFSVPINFETNTGGADRTDITGSADDGNFSLVIRLFA